MSIDELREELNTIDRSLLELVARRQELSKEIGRIKQSSGLSPRNYEREVIHAAREHATSLGISPHLAESILLQLIQASLTVQEREKLTAEGAGSGKRSLIIGGAGKMGRWFFRYLTSQGYEVQVADPAGAIDNVPCAPDFRTISLDHDLIIIATPLRASNEILLSLARSKPHGLIIDIGSLKSPLRSGLHRCLDAGLRIASLHPMFGPDTELLSGRHVVIVDIGNADAAGEAADLFSSTMAIRVSMDLENHDRVMAFVLGLSHALNIAFFTALTESGETAPHLSTVSSTTFEKQLAVGQGVAEENPHLYFEIQSLNEFGDDALEVLQRSVEKLRTLIAQRDEAGFEALMQNGYEYLHSRKQA